MDQELWLPTVEEARDITQRYIDEHSFSGAPLQAYGGMRVTYTDPNKKILYLKDFNTFGTDPNKLYFGTIVIDAPTSEAGLILEIEDTGSNVYTVLDTLTGTSGSINNQRNPFIIWNRISNQPSDVTYFVGYEFNIALPISTIPLIKLTVNKRATNLVVEFDIATIIDLINDAHLTVDFGDGTVTNFDAPGASPGGGIYIYHTYAAEGLYDIQIFSDGDMYSFFHDTYYGPSLDAVTFNLYSSNRLTSFTLVDDTLNNFTPQWFGVPDTTYNISLQQNSLTIPTVNNLLIYLDSTGAYNGYLNTLPQTPVAPRQGAGVTAYNNLIAKGWSVSTDV
jgi:hypothetical protein